ncbi:MAG: MerR family transcriptional regulator [Rhodospirillales bacterium]
MNDGPSDNRDLEKTEKSATAFRTISEVAEDLDLPQHVLRFWETKFPQVKPMKRGGGRRYYRPDDMLLLRRIRDLLYVDGYTIKGVQKLLRQSGSVRNFVIDTEAAAPSGDNTDQDIHDLEAAILPPPPVGENPTAPVATDTRRELLEIVAELKGLHNQLVQSAS